MLLFELRIREPLVHEKEIIEVNDFHHEDDNAVFFEYEGNIYSIPFVDHFTKVKYKLDDKVKGILVFNVSQNTLEVFMGDEEVTPLEAQITKVERYKLNTAKYKAKEGNRGIEADYDEIASLPSDKE